MKIDTKGLFSKWLFAVLIIAAIFAIGTIDVFAADNSGTGNQGKDKYDIRDYKEWLYGNAYNRNNVIGEDVICSAGTNSANLISGDLNGNANVCNKSLDPTINEYPAWIILFNPQFSSSQHNDSTSFSNNSFVFTSNKEDEVKYVRWRQLDKTNETDGMNGIVGYNPGNQNTNILFAQTDKWFRPLQKL